MDKTNKAVLFLGSGATKGAGLRIRKNGTTVSVPTDSEFFIHLSKIVPTWENDYSALNLYRDPNQRDRNQKEDSLYKTWNDLFVYRNLARAGMIREDHATIESFHKLSNHGFTSDYEWRREHYFHQFQIINPEIRAEYYLAELAIWDLRTLVKEVYDQRIDLNGNEYLSFWDKIQKKLDVSIEAVVNLNYDTTFDDSFKDQGPWEFYYPGNGKSRIQKIPLIRPHGSLKWTSHSHWEIGKGWAGWVESFTDTGLHNMGYRRIEHDWNTLDFRQSLIVTPADFKEEIVGNSTLPGLQSSILRNQWLAMNTALKECSNWIFVGISFESGDNHLLWLLNKNFGKNKNVFCSALNSCGSIKKLQGSIKNKDPISIGALKLNKDQEKSIDDFEIINVSTDCPFGGCSHCFHQN